MNATQLLLSAMVMSSTAICGSASAQTLNGYLDRKYDILQQEADAEAKRAEAERERAEAQRNHTSGQQPTTMENRGNSTASRSSPLLQGEALAGANVPKCTLSNGITLSASGGFRPSQALKAKCTK